MGSSGRVAAALIEDEAGPIKRLSGRGRARPDRPQNKNPGAEAGVS